MEAQNPATEMPSIPWPWFSSLRAVAVLVVEHYQKGEVKEVDYDASCLPVKDDTVNMKVNYGSKIKNLLGFALKKLNDPAVRQMTWSGSGNALTKVVSCVEVIKRKITGLHQTTHIGFKRVEEYWEPTLEGLERLKVNKDVPSMTILLSKDPPEDCQPGYQPPGKFEAFWLRGIQQESKAQTKGDQRKSRRGTAPAGGQGASGAGMPSLTKKRKQRDTKWREEGSSSGVKGAESAPKVRDRGKTKHAKRTDTPSTEVKDTPPTEVKDTPPTEVKDTPPTEVKDSGGAALPVVDIAKDECK